MFCSFSLTTVCFFDIIILLLSFYNMLSFNKIFISIIVSFRLAIILISLH